MKKFTLFLSFVFAFLTASAQEVTVTSLDQLSNDKTYFIESARCFLMYNTTANADGISTSTASNLGTSTVAKDWTDANQQFKIENIDGSYYLYSVGAAKYVTSNGGFSDTATDALGLTPASDATYNWKLTIGGNGMNSQEPGQMDAGIVVNSWTTEDPGNRYKIIDTEASTVVVIDYPNEFSEFDQNKCYTVTTTSRGGWAVANDAFCSTNDASLGTTSNPADANQQFAVLSNDGENYYLYSVGAKKFVKSDKSLIAGRGEAIELADASSVGECRVRVNFKGYTNKYINLGGGKQMIIDGWSDVDAGNAVAFIEAGDFDPTEALAMLNNVATITYKFQYEGNIVATQEVVAVPGEAYPDYTLSAPYGVTGAAKPEGTVSSDETVTIELTITKALPFEAVAEGEPTKWYYAQIHGNFLSYMTNPGVGAEMPWKINGELITAVDEANADNYTWGFVGNLWTGFKMVSKAGGAIKSTGSGNVTIVESLDEATAFIAMAPATSSNAAAESGFCLLNAEAGQYINAQNVGVNHWTANDAGSTIVVTEREITVEPEPEVQPTSATFNFADPTTLNPAVTPSETPSAGVDLENNVTFTNNNVTVNINKGTATTNIRIWTANAGIQLRTYKGSTITIAAPTGTKLTEIVFEGGKVSDMTADGFSEGTWTGEAQSVEFAVTGTLNVTAINVTLKIDNAISVGAPVASVESGVYTTAQSVTFTSEYANIENPTINYYYTTDGSEPTSESTMVEGAIEVTENCTINVVAVITVDDKEYTSEVATYEYIISANLRYVAVTAAEQIVAGKALIVANNLAVFSSEKAYDYLPGREVTVTDGAVKEPVYYGFEFEAAEGGWYIKDHNGKYIYMTGDYNSFNMSETVPAEGGIWTVAIAEDGTATITNATTGKYMQYSTKFSSYGAYAEAQEGGVVPTLYMPTEFGYVAVSPAEAVTSLREITIEFSDDIVVKELTGTDRISIDYGYNVLIGTTATAEGNILKLVADTEIKDKGVYPLAIPAGVVTRAADGAEYAGGTFKFEVIKAAAPFAVTKVTPSESVETLSEITIEFSDAVNVPMTASGKFTITDASSNAVAEFAAWEATVNNNVVTLKLATPIEVEGEYTLTIPEGLVSRQSDSATLSYTCTFTVAKAAENPLTVVKVTPEEAVAELTTITFEFSDEIVSKFGGTDYIRLMPTASANTYRIMDIAVEGKVVTLTMPEVITTPDTYTLNFPADKIARASDGALYAGETFTFTVAVAEGIDGINGEAGNATIYDLTGRKIEKITEGGIYIVNGKKVLVK